MSVRGSNEWTDADMLLALRLRDAGRSYDQIARHLSRSTMATRVMINKIARDLAKVRGGVMGKRSTFPRRERDFYATPPMAVAPLLPHLPYGASFVEPCAGNMALVTSLEQGGASCLHALDIEPRHPDVIRFDALDDNLGVWVESADFIITNPPWSRDLLHPMIQSFAALRPTWLLFDADWVHTGQALPYFPLLRVIVSVGRVRWFPDSKMTGKDNCAWHLFDARAPGPAVFYGRS